MLLSEWVNKCHFGDVRTVLKQMIADGIRVNTIVCSPPYWGLRDYGHAGQIGLEPSLPEFLAVLVEVFDLCRQVLADDGTAWVNMGDSYAANRGTQPAPTNTRNKTGHVGGQSIPVNLKPKDMVGQPWRLAFALQDAGWWLRQDIIWAKPNPMPESIKDRCTKAHEYLFLLAKSERYYFDQEAILEKVSAGTHARLAKDIQNQVGSVRANGGAKTNGNMKAVARGVGWGHGSDADQRGRGRVKNNDSFNEAMAIMPTMRNRRSVWTIPTESYSGAHFATYPRALVEPCILAGCPVGGIVLDPFFGSGTTGQVAQNLGRRFIGIEINRDNEPLQRERLSQPGLDLEAA